MDDEGRQDLCHKCGTAGIKLRTGTASGRNHYKCPSCGSEWREKNLAAVAMGRLGGAARAAAMSKQERVSQAEVAAAARWAKEKGEPPILATSRGIVNGKPFGKQR